MKDPKKKYCEYRDWLEEKLKDESTWDFVKSERQCSNWNEPHNAPIPWNYGEWCLYTSDMKALASAAKRNHSRNTLFIGEAMKHVGGNPDAPLLNPHYVEAAEKLKEIRQKIKDYSADANYASDVLFSLKKQADVDGKQFVDVAKEEIDKMNGKHLGLNEWLPGNEEAFFGTKREGTHYLEEISVPWFRKLIPGWTVRKMPYVPGQAVPKGYRIMLGTIRMGGTPVEKP